MPAQAVARPPEVAWRRANLATWRPRRPADVLSCETECLHSAEQPGLEWTKDTRPPPSRGVLDGPGRAHLEERDAKLVADPDPQGSRTPLPLRGRFIGAKDGILCRDVEDPDHFYLLGEWADIQEHARIRRQLAEMIKPEFVKYIEGKGLVPKYAQIVSSTPQHILDGAAR